jgi:hypothetical protein
MIEEKIIIKSGDWKEIFSTIVEYFEKYHPAGYGTTVKIELTYEGVVLTFERFSTCD